MTSVSPRIWTVGHSSRSLPELVAMLSAHEIRCVADVRRVPASRRHPQFGRILLEQGLSHAGLGYLWQPALGGMRSPRPGSPHTACREPAFAGYADHMETAEWGAGAQALIERAAETPMAILCAEAHYVECHRQLIADALVIRGVEVLHVIDATRTEAHRLTPFVRLDGLRLIYDRGQLAFDGLS